jgi:4-hydroxy-2-oxoheptanedioate aldolase
MIQSICFERKWKSDVPLWGGWCSIASAGTAEIIGRAGYDWVGIDFQHGAMSLAGVDAMLCAVALSRVPAFVRVSSAGATAEICKVLDFGATGIIVPVVNTPEDALMATQACRYEPAGIRSWAGPLVRASMADPTYTPQTANARVKCILMIETLTAVERIDDILEVPGIDGIFVGPSDLAHSCGLAPSLFADDREHIARIDCVFRAAQRHGVVAGIYAGTVTAAQRWRQLGARFLALTDDSTLLRLSASAMMNEARSMAPVAETRLSPDDPNTIYSSQSVVQ